MAMLLTAQQVAGPTQFQIESGDAESRAEIAELADGSEPPVDDGARQGHEGTTAWA